MKKATAIILTSKYEGFPVIYNEALVLEKKVITTVPVSDSEIDIRDYFIVVDNSPKIIFNEIMKINNNDVNNNEIDFQKINNKRITKIKKII
jgi:glycosyltransferase involved in cell wall biosynthesis